MMTDLELTDEQLELVEQPAGACLLVTAGAGTGKTFSLIRRIEFLIEDGDLSAAEILVLSFSRAAVGEVHDRLTRCGTAAADVHVSTFDSYAGWILEQADPEGAWQKKSFDQRIREAHRLLREEDGNAIEFVRETRHLIVDEVQDLVGDRAELIKALLDTVVGGFTLLGDPAQGIYNFQLTHLRPEERILGANALFEWVRTRFGDDLVEVTLTQNFRVRDPEAAAALGFGPRLGAVNTGYAGIQRDLRRVLLARTHDLGTLAEAIPVIAKFEVPTAMLCRNNGEALLISRELHHHSVPHRLQRSAQDRVLPAWIARLFCGLESTWLSKDDVIAVLERTGASAREAWILLKRMDSTHRNRSLDLTAVRDRLARGQAPDELTRQHQATLVVSTIHRAKGLEFDQVVVVDPGDARDYPVVQVEESRNLYVAMTRARDLLMHIKPVNGLGEGHLRRLGSGRWVAGTSKDGDHFAMEIRNDDVHFEDPAGTVGFSAPVRETQEYLATQVRSGDRVSLAPLPGEEPRRPPRYVVEHDGNRVGVTSDVFGNALRGVLPARGRRDWPLAIVDLRVDCVESVAGSEAAGINQGLGWSGIWLRPRIVGLGRFTWMRTAEA